MTFARNVADAPASTEPESVRKAREAVEAMNKGQIKPPEDGATHMLKSQTPPSVPVAQEPVQEPEQPKTLEIGGGHETPGGDFLNWDTLIPGLKKAEPSSYDPHVAADPNVPPPEPQWKALARQLAQDNPASVAHLHKAETVTEAQPQDPNAPAQMPFIATPAQQPRPEFQMVAQQPQPSSYDAGFQAGVQAVEKVLVKARGAQAMVPPHFPTNGMSGKYQGDDQVPTPKPMTAKMQEQADAISMLGWMVADMDAKMMGKKKEHPVSEAQRRWAFAAEKRGELPKGKAREWSRRKKGQSLPASTGKMQYSDQSDRDLRKGLYAFEDYGDKSAKLPKEMLGAYLQEFVEQAYEHERREPAHKNMHPRADQDIHDFWAGRVMGKLVCYAVKNKNLMAAAKGVTKDQIAMILRTSGIVRPESKSYTHTDRDSMSAMGATIGPDVAVDEPMAYSQNAWAVTTQSEPAPRVGLQLAKSDPRMDENGIIDDRGDPFQTLAKAQAAHMAWMAPDAPVGHRLINNNCMIHGMGDLTKTMNLSNPMGHCTCPR